MVAVIVLLLNDHLLKQAWPGFVTGKLSDVAGLVVAPPLVALLFRRRADAVAVLLTGALFALVKSTETGADAASQVWSLLAGPSRVLADFTDLLALPALALAWWVRQRTLGEDSPRRRVLVTMPLAVLAVTATSGSVPPPGAYAVETGGDRITVFLALNPGPEAVTSQDGGRTWTTWEGAPERAPQSAACVPRLPQRCYRILEGGRGVAESDDYGRTWRGSWEQPEYRRELLARRYGDAPGVRLRALAVQARAGGHVVVVAGGLDGIVVRETSGEWRRVGWPGPLASTEDDDDGVLDPERDVAIVLAVAMLLASVATGLRRYYPAFTVFAALGCFGLYVLLETPDEHTVLGVDPAKLAAGLGLTVVSAVVCGLLAIDGRARPSRVAIGLGTAPLVYAGVYLPFLGWSVGVPPSYAAAVAVAVVLASGAIAGGVALIRRDARRTPDYLAGSRTSSPT
ncbi:hypothetical protein ABT294_30750 [Nonomuraea sp. NPDC000554]|uniref:hypothetical protein n=1 Tax=Nonomuraea sp. NPDC000554 TaxID=3154259 RepID=UPI003327E992